MLSPIQSILACEDPAATERLAKGRTAAVPPNRLPAVAATAVITTKGSGHRRIPCQCNKSAKSGQTPDQMGAGFGQRRQVVSQAGDPENFRIAAEPGPLALGVLACFELRGGDGLFQGELSAQMAKRLLIPERFERLFGPRCALSKKLADLFEKTAIKHCRGTRIQPLMEDGAVRVQADLDVAVSFQRLRLGRRGQGTAGQQTHLQGAGELLHITE